MMPERPTMFEDKNEPISREAALLRIATAAWSVLTDDEKRDILLDWNLIDTDEYEEDAGHSARTNPPSVAAPESVSSACLNVSNAALLTIHTGKFRGVKNQYIASLLYSVLGQYCRVSGDVEDLVPCDCCGFKTMREDSFYDICPACRWEDTGQEDRDREDGCNRGSLNGYLAVFLADADYYAVVKSKYFHKDF